MAVTVSGIKEQLKPHIYASLCGGGTDTSAQDAYCQTAINDAITSVKSMLAKYRIAYDEAKDIIHRAVELMTIYELYARIENEEEAQDKKARADELLANSYGGGYQDEGSSTHPPQAGSPLRQPIAKTIKGTSIKDKVLGSRAK